MGLVLGEVEGVSPDELELCFISDRNQSIQYAVKSIYPLAEHGACFWHVSMNIRQCFKSGASIGIYKRAVEAYRVEEFNKHFDELRQGFPRVANFLEGEVEFQKWSRAHFQGNKYEVMAINIVETMMRVAREYPKNCIA